MSLIHVACLRMCVLFYLYVVCQHVRAYAFKLKVHCGSALGPGASGLPYYFTPPVTVPDVIGGLVVWQHNNQKKKKRKKFQKQTSYLDVSETKKERKKFQKQTSYLAVSETKLVNATFLLLSYVLPGSEGTAR